MQSAATRRPRDPVRVVTAGGDGVGRFLAAALLEALQVGGEVSVTESTDRPAGCLAGFDFVFRRPRRAEVIRVGVDAAHRVVSAELYRGQLRATGKSEASLWPDGLMRALGEGESVAEVKWHRSPSASEGLEIVMRRDCRFSVPLRG